METVIQLERPEMTIWFMLTNATNTCSEQAYVILIGFTQQQWRHECASMSHSIYINCLVDIHKLDY